MSADALAELHLGAGPAATAPAADSDPLLERVRAALAAYFADGRTRFVLPLAPQGTAFQLRVWQALRRIPAGETVTYGELARRLSSSPRAIGGACRANPIPIVIPCHRVVAAGGPGGFMGARAGAPLAVKQWLLRHEGAA